MPWSRRLPKAIWRDLSASGRHGKFPCRRERGDFRSDDSRGPDERLAQRVPVGMGPGSGPCPSRVGSGGGPRGGLWFAGAERKRQEHGHENDPGPVAADVGPCGGLRGCGGHPCGPYFPSFLCGAELVRYYGKLTGMDGKALERRVEELLALVRLGGEAGRRPLRTYSKGMLQRIGLAGALVSDPEIVMLDEPTAGVDPAGSREIRDLIRSLKQAGKTVVFSSHLLEQVEDVADRVVILHRGEKLREGRLEELLTLTGEWQVRTAGLGEAPRRELREWLRERGAKILQEGAPRERLEEYYLRSLPEGETR
ncbi:MAG: ABC transporter ATP-binding protein [Verrucomicrobia bacterium]|nr:ABC transporter ATP-binding protein [Verrucomicrobiota bacterium]